MMILEDKVLTDKKTDKILIMNAGENSKLL